MRTFTLLMLASLGRSDFVTDGNAFEVSCDLKENFFEIRSVSAPEKYVFRSSSADFLTVIEAVEVKIKEVEGNYDIQPNTASSNGTRTLNGTRITKCEDAVVSGYVHNEDITFDIAFSSASEDEEDCCSALDMSISVHASSSLRERAKTTDKGSDVVHVVQLKYAAEENQAYFGFGEQYDRANLKGSVVPVLVSEQGVGRGLEPLSLFLGIAAGNAFTTYAPMPLYQTSETANAEAHAFALRTTRVCVFDTSETELTTLSILFDANEARVFDVPITLVRSNENDNDRAPLNLLQGLTGLVTGRMRKLPSWITSNGAILATEGGEQAVMRTVRTAKDAGVPVAAVWVQDWSGLRSDAFGKRVEWNWDVDPEHYPNWNDFLRNLRNVENVRFMSYINPYLANNALNDTTRRDLFNEAERLGHLVKTKNTNETYLLSSGSATFTFGTVDLTSPAARDWFARVIRCDMLGDASACLPNQTVAEPVDGWMCDFGEYLPFLDIRLNGSSSPWTAHNVWPTLWAEVNRDAVGDDDEKVFFMRSGYTRAPNSTRLYWSGDQLVTFDGYDGLTSAVVSHLSSGFSGMTLKHTDIGGYTMVDEYEVVKYLRTKELQMRWTEFSAFGDVVFRTHIGNLPNRSWQFDSDNETLAHFARFARVHAALASYRDDLMDAAEAFGHPITRHMYLHYPRDPETIKIKALDTQFLLGYELLVAPVLTKGASSVRVYLPYEASGWTNVWTNQTWVFKNKTSSDSGGMYVTCEAPMGSPPVFYRTGRKEGEALAERVREAAGGA
eukprot:g1159.t1